jgi:hypothetical protein
VARGPGGSRRRRTRFTAAEHLDGLRPERAQPGLAPLAAEPHGGGGAELEGADGRAGGFVGPRPGGVEEEQQGGVALALRAPALGRAEHGVDLRLLEGGHRRRRGPAEGEGLDLRGEVDELGDLPPDEAEERVARGQALVAGGD